MQDQLSVRALEAKLKHLQKAHKPKSKKKHPHAVFIKAAAEELTTTWNTRVEIKSKGKSGVVVLHFGSEGELDRLFEGLKHGPKIGVRR
jgi:ParB family chromosome partitioning protein